MTTKLALFDAMHQAIVAAHGIDEVKQIRDRAAALRQYARQSRESIEDINRLAEIKLRAERRGGELLTDLERAQGQRTDLVETSVQPEPKLTLKAQVADAGLSLAAGKRWQMLAELPALVFDSHIDAVKDAGAELTTSFMLRMVQEHRRDVRRQSLAEPGAFPAGLFRVLYADPPWQYGNNGVKSEADNYGTVERHYPTLPTAAIGSLERDGRRVADLVLPDAVLFLWATVAMLPDAFAVVDAWGFTYKTHFVWDKQRHNFGHYSSVQHELLLVGTCGSCLPDVDDKLASVVRAPREEHSVKPEHFRAMIDTLYPHGPRLELFRRGAAPAGWHVWGNEAA
jgi:N6-adenosine-specific RNA methylase IME4